MAAAPLSSDDPAINEKLREEYFTEKLMTFENGCDELKDPTACFSLAEFHQLVNKDNEKAAGIYRTNCEERKHGNSCFNLSVMYREFLPGPAPEATVAWEGRRFRCREGHSATCTATPSSVTRFRMRTRVPPTAIALRLFTLRPCLPQRSHTYTHTHTHTSHSPM